ncbi:MAG: hypothetical protein ACWGO1_09600, partial [Anaerolineales bacterium]
QSGPDGGPGLHEIYRYFRDFIQDIPLNSGSYRDSEAVTSDPGIRVVGQIDAQHNLAHLWVQNKNHTWKNVVDRTGGISGLSGTVALNGFTPSTILPVEWHTFTTEGIPAISHTTASTDSHGMLLLNLPSNPDITDVGIKIGMYTK